MQLIAALSISFSDDTQPHRVSQSNSAQTRFSSTQRDHVLPPLPRHFSANSKGILSWKPMQSCLFFNNTQAGIQTHDYTWSLVMMQRPIYCACG